MVALPAAAILLRLWVRICWEHGMCAAVSVGCYQVEFSA